MSEIAEYRTPRVPTPSIESSLNAKLLPTVLSVIAGSVDAIGFLGLGGLFTAHVTGNLVILAAHLVSGSGAPVAPMLSVPVFVAALGLTRLLAGALGRIGLASLRPLLLLQLLLLVGFLVLCASAGPRIDPDATKAILAGMLGVSAMAVQNALVQISLKGAPSTAVMTTNITRFVMDVGDVMLARRSADVAKARDRAMRTWPAIVGFAIGCGAGAICEAAIGLWSMYSARAGGTARWRVAGALRSVGPALLFGLRVWAAVSLALYVAFWLELDNAYWAGTSAAIVCQPSLGASLRKASFRMIGTVFGAVAIVVLTACFPQSRIGFLVGLAVWGAACGFVATILRNFASYGAALAGFTAVVIASDLLGATGGVNGEVFTLAVTRVSEICIGIICAGIVVAGTDFGRARGRLAAQFAALSAEVTAGLSGTLAGPIGEKTRSTRRDLIRRVIALDPVIDEAIGETSDLRYRLRELLAGVGGLFAALSGWRTVANHLRSEER